MDQGIPEFAKAQARGPIAAASAFLDAIQAGDVDAACEVSIAELQNRLRSGLAEELREKWRDVDGEWGWTADRRVVGPDLELVLLVDRGETGYVKESTPVESIPFVIQHADIWRVYALTVPEEGP